MMIKFYCFLIFIPGLLLAQVYPDQIYVVRTDSIYANVETSSGIKLSDDGKSIVLQDSVLEGFFVLKTQFSQFPFNEGLPSWNGNAPHSGISGFKVQMRFPYGTGMSPWLTVGFWKNNIWSTYGATSFGQGYIDYDNVKLNLYSGRWQFRVQLNRSSVYTESPSINKLSFFVSDSRTTSSINYTEILNDNPPAIFIPTTFVYQYGVDPDIGGQICSPTSVAMILKSYNIAVDPLHFAQDTYDPHFNMFGIWPRVVQNAHEYGLDGAVTRYRTWSEAQAVLAAGGRISMSVGQPLYTGHLIMLAGFNASGNPIVHDPARSNGYSYVYNKSDLSRSWFAKGGVAYTFFPSDSTTLTAEPEFTAVKDFELFQNYPNPFNPATIISYELPKNCIVTIRIFDILGNEVKTIVNEEKSSGRYSVEFDAGSLSSGTYIYRIQAGDYTSAKKMIFIK